MARQQLQNNYIAYIAAKLFHSLQSRRHRHYIPGSATVAFCEYGGTQNRPEHNEKPVNMPPMDLRAIGGILPCSTPAQKHDSMPPFCKIAIHASTEKATMFGQIAECCWS